MLHSLVELSFDPCIATTYHSGWHTGSVGAVFVDMNCHPISYS